MAEWPERRPRKLTTDVYNTGTVGMADGGTVLTGVGTTFNSSMVGSVLRISGNNKPPTNSIDSNPAAYESVVFSYVSPTQLVMADPAPQVFASSPYLISDPIDLEQGAMLNCFNRLAEKQVSMLRTFKDRPSAAKQFSEALEKARAADSCSFMGRASGPQNRVRLRLRDMPVGPDEP